MTRRISAAIIVLTLFADTAPPAAQVRIRGDGGPPAPIAGRIREAPSTRSTGIRAESPPPPTDARSTARLKFVLRPPDLGQLPVLWPMGLGWASFGYVPLWASNGLTPLQTAAAAVPLSEGAPMGGVQLDIEPRGAHVYVDSAYMGLISDFSGYYHHLELAAGPHLITIVAPDYEPLIIGVIVSPGRTMTHRGTLTPAYGR